MATTNVFVATVPDAPFSDLIQVDLILFTKDGRLWIERKASGLAVVPQVHIPRWSRIAHEVTKAASNKLGLDVICLRDLDGKQRTSFVVVAEIVKFRNNSFELEPITIRELSVENLGGEVVEMIMAAHEESFAATGPNVGEPFKRIGWFDDLRLRIDAVIEPQGRTVTGEIQQLNGSPSFSLLKIETTTTPLWFKAVGVPNVEECSLSIGLHELMPKCVPTVIAHFPDWNGWVAEDVGGERLGTYDDVETWEASVAQFAKMQISSLGHVEDLLSMGCKDGRASVLRSNIPIFRAVIDEAMTSTDHSRVARLTSSQVQHLARMIEESIAELELVAMPATLVHRDLTGGNIQISPSGARFLDWAQACVTYPFVCLDYFDQLLARQWRGAMGVHIVLQRIEESYTLQWAEILGADQIAVARSRSPLLAKYLSLLRFDGADMAGFLDSFEQRRFLRSMARLMWRNVAPEASLRSVQGEL